MPDDTTRTSTDHVIRHRRCRHDGSFVSPCSLPVARDPVPAPVIKLKADAYVAKSEPPFGTSDTAYVPPCSAPAQMSA